MKPTEILLWTAPLAIAAAFVVSSSTSRPTLAAAIGQDATSRADSAKLARSGLKSGDEMLLIFIGASFCHAADVPGFPKVVETMKGAFRSEAGELNVASSIIGAALDWDPTTGLNWLHNFGSFDQVTSGGNWLNLAAVNYIFRDVPGQPALPQVLVVRRHVTISKGDIEVSDERLVARKLGADEITQWVRAGLPLPHSEVGEPSRH